MDKFCLEVQLIQSKGIMGHGLIQQVPTKCLLCAKCCSGARITSVNETDRFPDSLSFCWVGGVDSEP